MSAITEISSTKSNWQKYLLIVLLGALLGGLVVALVTKAAPKVMSQMMAGMMKNMMAQMKADESPCAEMWRRMNQSAAQSQPAETTGQ